MAETLGAKLKRAREASGVALRDIALTTKISVSALESLERNDFSRLPGGIFSRAFIRSYATAVGLDPEATVQDFLAEVNRSEKEGAEVATARAEVTPEDRAFLDRQKQAIRLLQIAGVLVVIAAGTGATFAWMRWAKPSDAAPRAQQAASQPPAAAPASPPPTSPAPVPLPPAPLPPAAPAAASPQSATPQGAVPKPADPPAAKPAPPPTKPPPTTEPPATKPPPVDPKAGASGMPVTAVPTEEPPPVPVPPAPTEPLTVEFEVTAPCFVEIAADGKVSFTKAMEPGDRQRIQAQRDLVLRVGDAGAFRWTLNGKRARPLGPAGAARSARVTQANFKKFIQ